MRNQNPALKILEKHASDWDEDKSTYQTSEEDMLILIEANSKIIHFNQPGKSGGFVTKVIFEEKTFICFSEKPIKRSDKI